VLFRSVEMPRRNGSNAGIREIIICSAALIDLTRLCDSDSENLIMSSRQEITQQNQQCLDVKICVRVLGFWAWGIEKKA
jgi:hypothetical protein